MIVSTQKPCSQMSDLKIQEKSGLKDLICAFGKVEDAIDTCRLSLPQPDASAVSLDIEQLRQGVPVLAQAAAYSIEYHLEKTVPAILPALAETFNHLAPMLAHLEKTMQTPATVHRFNDLLAHGDQDLLDKTVAEFEMAGFKLDPTILAYVLECLGRPALEALALALAPLLVDLPWNFWNRGYCPICGSKSSMSLLRMGQQEPTEFLKNSSAQRWLCCSGCAHTWRFSRTSCPECGTEKQNDREYFYVEENPLQRVELCETCRHYLLTMDIRERLSPVNHRFESLGLAHLDILASQQGYAPMVSRPWKTC